MTVTLCGGRWCGLEIEVRDENSARVDVPSGEMPGIWSCYWRGGDGRWCFAGLCKRPGGALMRVRTDGKVLRGGVE